MTIDHRQNHLEGVRWVRSTLSVGLYPLQYLANIPRNLADWLADATAGRKSLREENEALRRQRLLLKAELQKQAALKAENARLRDLLGSSVKVEDRVLIAELQAVDMDPYRQQIVVNKGSKAEVFTGQPVLDARGVMGQITHVTPLTSTVVLITDASHAIPVQVNRNGLRSIAVGTGIINRLELPYLPNNAEIQVGDLLVTSGLAGRFPPGYPVARVTAVAQDPGRPFAQVIATPSAHLERSREVLLVWTGSTTGEAKATPPPLPSDAAVPATEPAPAPEQTGGESIP